MKFVKKEKIETPRLSLRPITEGDAAEMIALITDDEVKQTYMIPDLPERDQQVKMFKRFCDLSVSEEHFVYGICKENEVIGFINVWVVAGEINLNNIALTEKSRGRGLGRALIEYMENNEQAERCNLEVRVSNERAIGLYRSLGFEEVGLRKGFYSEPTEDALLMTKRYGET